MFRNGCGVCVLALALTALAAGQKTAPVPDTPGSDSQGHAAKKHPISIQDRDRAEQLFLKGAKDVERDDLRAAVDVFTKAAALDPGNPKYGMSEEIARQHWVTELVQQADKARILGHSDEARAKIAEAYRIDPRDPVAVQHVSELARGRVAGEPATSGESDAEAAPPIQLRPKPLRLSFHLHDNERNVISKVLPAYGIQPTLDESVGVQRIRFDVDDADFATAEQALALATNSFFVPLDPARALVAKDSLVNRTKYEREAAETVYMPGMTQDELAQMINVAKNVFGVKTATSEADQEAITIRGPAKNLAALNATLNRLLEGRGEVQLDVRMYEIDRTKAVNLGLILPNTTTLFNVYSEARNLLNSNSSLVQEIISSGLAAPGDWEAILAILIASGQISNSILTQPFGVFGGGLSMTGVIYGGGSLNLQLNSSDVRSLDQLQLRALDGEEATIRSGEKYPIETSNYSSLGATSLSIPGISTSGLSSTLQNLGVNVSQLQSAAEQTIPQVQYQDIGLTLKVTPRIQGEKNVSLKLDLQLSALAGSALNGLPLMDNRQYQAITTVGVGETTVLVSSLSRQESNAITGVPGLSDLPGFQDTTNTNSNLDVAELAIVITPHIVRPAPREDGGGMYLLPVKQ
jgi:general secretion pathway protein D